MAAIAIDFGFTSSTVCVWHADSGADLVSSSASLDSTCPSPSPPSILTSTETICDEFGNIEIPSVMSYLGSGFCAGATAVQLGASYTHKTVSGVKRLLGTAYNNDGMQCIGQAWEDFPFQVTSDEDSKLKIQIDHGRSIVLAPEEIASDLMQNLKQMAEAHLRESVTRAVIAVPALFTDAQRRATLHACKMAGLEVLGLIFSPTAAALTYITSREQNVLFCDFGGGSLDVAVVNIDGRVLETKANAGDTLLGGTDFTARLVEHCVEEAQRMHGLDLTGRVRALHRLRAHCDRAKCQLSSELEATIAIESLAAGVDLHLTVSRALFEQLCRDLFDRAISAVRSTLAASKLPLERIHAVVLLGGAAHMPRFRTLLHDTLGPGVALTRMRPEAVAQGAAVQLAVLTNQLPAHCDRFLVLDATPYAIGIEGGGGLREIIPRYTMFPCHISRTYTTFHDSAVPFSLSLFEGSRLSRPGDCRKLGQFRLLGVCPAPRGVPRIVVTFTVTADGVLEITAEDQTDHVAAQRPGDGGGLEPQRARRLRVVREPEPLLSSDEVEAAAAARRARRREWTEEEERQRSRDRLEQLLQGAQQAISDQVSQAEATRPGGGGPSESGGGRGGEGSAGAASRLPPCANAALADGVRVAAGCVDDAMLWLLGAGGAVAGAKELEAARGEVELRCAEVLPRGEEEGCP